MHFSWNNCTWWKNVTARKNAYHRYCLTNWTKPIFGFWGNCIPYNPITLSLFLSNRPPYINQTGCSECTCLKILTFSLINCYFSIKFKPSCYISVYSIIRSISTYWLRMLRYSFSADLWAVNFNFTIEKTL
jgi:hypothetical protein